MRAMASMETRSVFRVAMEECLPEFWPPEWRASGDGLSLLCTLSPFFLTALTAAVFQSVSGMWPELGEARQCSLSGPG